MCSTPCLRDVAPVDRGSGSTPDAILRWDVKKSCTSPKHLGWGTDTTSIAQGVESARAFPSHCDRPARVVRSRTGGDKRPGVWKGRMVPDGREAVCCAAFCRPKGGAAC